MNLSRPIRGSGVRAKVVAAILTFGAALLSPAPAQAQFAIDKTEMFLNAGDSLGGVLMVRNEGSQRGQATIKLEDWDRAEDGSNRFFTAGSHPQSCAPLLRVFPLTVSLGAGESQAIRIDLDQATSKQMAKECWSVVLVESATPETNANGRTLLYRLRTGLKVYVLPRGVVAEGQISDVAIHMGSRDAGDAKDTVDVAFQNVGSKHVIGRGRIEVRRPDNSTVAIVDLPPAYALPGATMRVKGALQSLPVGRYVILAVMDYGGAEIAAAQLEHEVRE